MTTFQVAKADQVVSRTTRTEHATALGMFFAEVDGADPTGASSAVAAINSCIATNGSAYLVGTYLIDNPIQIHGSDQKITFAPGSKLLIESGYTGDVIQIGGGSSSIRHSVVQGPGTIIEQGKAGGGSTTLGAWTAFRFLAGTGFGVIGCRINGPIVWWCDTVVAYEAQGSGWVNSCYVSEIVPMYYRSFVKTITPTGNGYSGNRVSSVLGQSSTLTQFGVENLCGNNWDFDSVSLFDLPSTAVGLQVNSAAPGPIRVKGGFIGFRASDPNGVVQFQENYQTPPWVRTEWVRRDEMTEQTSLAGTPTKVTTGDWPAWSLQDANCGVTLLWRVPNGVSQVEVSVSLMDLSGTGATGNAHIKVQTRSAPGGGLTTRDLVAANPTANTAPVLVAGLPFNVTAGTIMQLAIWRNGSAADDTLNGVAIGLLGVALRPIK